MPSTLRDCVAEVRQAYEGCTDAIALNLVREALRALCDEFAVGVERATISLVAGQSRYDLPERWAGLRSVALLTSGPYDTDGPVELLDRDDVEGMDDQGTLYRFEKPGDVRFAMVDAGQLVLVPAPSYSTPTIGGASGYPRLDVEATVAPSLGPNAPLPAAVRSTDPIVNRACRRYARTKDKPNMMMWKALEDESWNEFERWAKRRNRQYRPQSYPEDYNDAQL